MFSDVASLQRLHLMNVAELVHVAPDQAGHVLSEWVRSRVVREDVQRPQRVLRRVLWRALWHCMRYPTALPPC